MTGLIVVQGTLKNLQHKKKKQFVTMYGDIYADGDCSHEIKRLLLLRRKAMTNLDSIFKSRDITLLIKVHVVKAMAFFQ